MRIIYTYDTNNGENYCSGYTFVDGFVYSANVSVRSCILLGHSVEIYADSHGVKFLKEKLLDSEKVNFYVVDFSRFNYDRRFWNFAKLVNYSIQTSPFIHVDFDIVFHYGFGLQTKGQKNYIITEMRRDVDSMLYSKMFPEIEEKQDNIICSGILGGDRIDIFNSNFRKAVTFCANGIHKNVRFDHLVGIEEYHFTNIVDNFSDAKVIELNEKTYTHWQGSNKWTRFGKDIMAYYNLYFNT
jgi:hypothetical protein